MRLTPTLGLLVVMSVASAPLLGGCESPPRDAMGAVEYGSSGPESLEFVICDDDALQTATVRVGGSPTSPALIISKQQASSAGATPVRIDFSIDAARLGTYSDDLQVEDVRGFADAITQATPVTRVSAVFDESSFSAELPRSIPDGYVLLVEGANAESTGRLRSATPDVARENLVASCDGK